MHKKPQTFVIYYDGEPFRYRPGCDEYKRYQYTTLGVAVSQLNQLIERIEWWKKNNYRPWLKSVEFFNSVDITKFTIEEFGKVKTHTLKKGEGDDNKNKLVLCGERTVH